MRRSLTSLLTIALCFALAGASFAAEPASATAYVPSDAAAVLVVRVKKIMESKLLEPVIKSPQVAEQLKHLPIDVRTIDEVTLAAVPSKGERKSWEGLFCPVAVVRFAAATDSKEFMSKLAPPGTPKFEERKHQGKTYVYAARDMSFFQADERTMVLAEQEDTLKEVLTGGTAKSLLADKLLAAGTADDIVVVVLLDPMRDLIAKARAGLSADSAPQMSILKELASLPDLLKSVTLTINLSSATLAKADLECLNAGSGVKARDTLVKALDAVKPLAVMAALMARSSPDIETPQFTKDAIDVGSQLLDGIRLTSAGDYVVVAVAKPKGLETLVASVPQAIAEVKAHGQNTARRTELAFNMHQIALAMLSYEQQAKWFFPTNICDKQGKPVLSWRVAILPFLGEKPLYDQFHLDEPWDSPNNKKLLERMPAVFQGQRTEKDGKTAIMVFAGKDTLFEDGKKSSLTDIADGASCTIMAVEAGSDKAVPWTKPEDLPFDPQNPAAALGNLPAGYFLAAMCDGAAFALRTDASAETLRRLINPRDGLRVDVDEATWSPGAKPRLPARPAPDGKSQDKSPAPLFKKG